MADIDLSADAALMRYSAGAGLNATFEPFKRGVALKAEGHAQVSLAEAKAQAKLYCPGEDGLLLYFQIDGKPYDLGAVRLQISASVSGVVGASISGELGLSIENKQVDNTPTEDDESDDDASDSQSAKNKRAHPARKTKMQQQREAHLNCKGKQAQRRRGKAAAVNQPESANPAEAGVELKVFAGAKADAEMRGAVEWRDPENQKKEFMELASITPMVGGMAGLAGELKFSIEYVQGMFRLNYHASLCFGLGAEGAMTLAVNALQLVKFQAYFYYTLLNLNFYFAEIFVRTAFEAMRDLCFLSIHSGEQIRDLLENSSVAIGKIIDSVSKDFDKAEQRISLAKKIMGSPTSLRYSPPETKGILLYQLTRHGAEDFVVSPGFGANYLPFQRRAALEILKWAQTQREMDNIIQHIGPRGEKGDLKQHLTKLHAFFRTEAPGDIDVPMTSSPYDEEFKKIYPRPPPKIRSLSTATLASGSSNFMVFHVKSPFAGMQ